MNTTQATYTPDVLHDRLFSVPACWPISPPRNDQARPRFLAFAVCSSRPPSPKTTLDIALLHPVSPPAYERRSPEYSKRGGSEPTRTRVERTEYSNAPCNACALRAPPYRALRQRQLPVPVPL